MQSGDQIGVALTMVGFGNLLLNLIIFSSVNAGFTQLLVRSSPAPLRPHKNTCGLDLSKELFGGVGGACSPKLDRNRCCPVLAAWILAAYSHSALQLSASGMESEKENLPMMPTDSVDCINQVQDALTRNGVKFQYPNKSCDAITCFCGIRLHQIASMTCPSAFNVSRGLRMAKPTPAVANLEDSCKNSSYAGCTGCLLALDKITLKRDQEIGVTGRMKKMLKRDCQLMGLTWLLTRNKTLYIPTVSAVLRATSYSGSPDEERRCSQDHENMPVAMDAYPLKMVHSSSSMLSTPAFYFSILVLRVYFWATMDIY